MEIKYIKVNKNRGWRGLAKVECYNTNDELIAENIFSFSGDMWDDLIKGRRIVVPINELYYILDLTGTDCYKQLPTPTQQRSVLIKNAKLSVEKVNSYEKSGWTRANGDDWVVIRNFIKNKNNHTQSDWNCIGIRVVPEI